MRATVIAAALLALGGSASAQITATDMMMVKNMPQTIPQISGGAK